MRKKYLGAGFAPTLLAICLLTMLTIMITACGTTATNPSNSPNTVLLEEHTFNPSSITIKKGESITLANNTATPHIIANGTWDNGTQKPNTEPEAPNVNNVMMEKKDTYYTVGPFNTAGTFQLYCPLHNGMNLTVIVK